MSSPQKVGSPHGLSSPDGFLHIPSPIITRRTRTDSTSSRALLNPIETGVVSSFSRSKGHGFIERDRTEDTEPIFVHISDIEGEYVPLPGDRVKYRVCPIPPKFEKYQAVHVEIVNFTPDVHLRWDSPIEE
ncbi:cold shock domain-containing protein CG9705 [Cimex lectularius]|uniref:CSD domain-containing protein n=1 Tax=Cimex lectularius TaxID=79782 RepID=A0A8I6R7C1_CIMLE|nr:cold shock domain-containing protein CG9705 [Cimex lectularius]XP_014240453.1 cold shock domain-containing protein CG9705 [Cimex lectularius]